MQSVDKLLGRLKGVPKIGVFIDAPNMMRKDTGVTLHEIKKTVNKLGSVKIAKVFLDQFATDKLIEAVTNEGFEALLSPTDVDVAMAVSVMDAVYTTKLDAIVLVTRDADFQVVLKKIKEHGKDAIVVAVKEGLSVALKNTADSIVLIEK